MAIVSSGTIRFPDHSNESTGQDITEEFGPDGSGQVSLKDYYRGGSKVPNNSANTGVPTTGEISLKDFYNAQDNNLDGNLAGTTGSFSWTEIKPAGTSSNQFPLNLTGTERSSNFWEMQTIAPQNGNNSSAQSLATGSIEICHDQANKRILILLLKDGTNAALAGGSTGLNAGYKILPYIGLENATWTVKVEYNPNSNGYDTTNGTIGTYNGSFGPGASLPSYSTSSTYHTVPTADTFLSIPTETGLSADGDTIVNESTRQLTWSAIVPGDLNNYQAFTGATATGSGFTGTRLHIKAVLGSETFQTVSAYWNIGLRAQKGFGF